MGFPGSSFKLLLFLALLISMRKLTFKCPLHLEDHRHLWDCLPLLVLLDDRLLLVNFLREELAMEYKAGMLLTCASCFCVSFAAYRAFMRAILKSNVTVLSNTLARRTEYAMFYFRRCLRPRGSCASLKLLASLSNG